MRCTLHKFLHICFLVHNAKKIGLFYHYHYWHCTGTSPQPQSSLPLLDMGPFIHQMIKFTWLMTNIYMKNYLYLVPTLPKQ